MSLVVENISKNYGDQKALDNISFSIKKGEIVGFLGPNGAGKSTLMKILTTYLKADNGSAIVNDFNVVTEQKNVQKSVGYLPEHNPLYLDLYVREYLRFNADVYGVAKTRIEEVIVLTGLTSESHKKIGALSKGYRQRVGLATALLHQPDVLILDEPTNGLDPEGIQEVRDLLKNLASQGTTVFVSSHLLSELEIISEYIVMLRKGEVVFAGLLQELMLAQQPLILVKTEKIADLQKVIDIAKADGHHAVIRSEVAHIEGPEEWAGVLNKKAFEAGITLTQLAPQLPNLEETFFEMTGDRS